MSQRVTSARLLNFEGPFFPDLIPVLNKLYNDTRPSCDDLHRAAQKMYGYCHTFRPKTSDGYEWLQSFTFLPYNSSYTILCFPWLGPYLKPCNLYLERSIAIYAKAEVSVVDMNSQTSLFITKLMDVMRVDPRQVIAAPRQS